MCAVEGGEEAREEAGGEVPGVLTMRRLWSRGKMSRATYRAGMLCGDWTVLQKLMPVGLQGRIDHVFSV